MNKKLLLSFAVFATALSVNAQKRGFKTPSLDGVKTPRHISVVSNELESNSILENVELNKQVSVNNSKKRAAKTVQDTSRFFVFKRSYASPATSSTILHPYYYPNTADATKDSIELTTCYQIIPNLNKSNVTYKGVTMQLLSLNKKQGFANVDVKVYDDKGATLAKATQKVLYSATAYGVYHFMFEKPITTTSDVFVAIEPNTVNDSVRVTTSGAYRNSSISCNIAGNKLTLVSPAPTTPVNIGTGFWTGQEITGTGIPAGTKIVSFAAGTYTISSTLTAPLSNIVVSGVNNKFESLKNQAGLMYFKFPVVAGTKNPDLTKTPLQYPDFIHYLNMGTQAAPDFKPFDAHITMYPIVEYTYEVNPTIDNKCLGDNKVVNVKYSEENSYSSIAKNPLLNQMAFWTGMLGWNKKIGYYYSTASVNAKSGGVYKDTLDNSNTTFAYKYTATTDTKNDTLLVTDFILPYGLFKPASMVTNQSTFLLSSKVSSTVNVIEPIKCFGGVAKVNLSATKGGFPPYVGEGDKTGVKAGVAIVTDNNGCSSDKITQPAAIVPVAKVTDAKCSGNKAIVAITATGGTGTLVLPKNDTLVAEATTKSYVVKDANLCEVKVDATIKAAPAAIVLDTVAVSAENKTKNNGLAVVKVTGGVAPYTYLWNDAAATKNDTLSKVIGAFKVTVTDANGCTKVADAIIRDKKVSVTELGLTNITVYPNPVKETLNVRFDATSIATVELVNVAGQVLDSKTNSDVTFNTAGLVAGMYFVNIKVAEGVYTHKIIKE